MSFLNTNTWRPEFVIIMPVPSANKIGLHISDMILERPSIYKRKIREQVQSLEELHV
jgi:hypothetical protein